MDIEGLINGLVYSFPKKEGNYNISTIKCGDGNEFRLTSSFLNLVDIYEKENMIVLSIRKERAKAAETDSQSVTKTTRFYNDIVKLEENTVQNMSKSSETWFRKNIPLHKIESMFRSCISRTSDLGQNIFRFKLSKKLKIFNESEENIISLDELKAIDKNSFRLQCSCLVDSLIIGRDAAKLDIKVTQIRIKKNANPKVVVPPPKESDDELDEDTFDCVEEPAAPSTTLRVNATEGGTTLRVNATEGGTTLRVNATEGGTEGGTVQSADSTVGGTEGGADSTCEKNVANTEAAAAQSAVPSLAQSVMLSRISDLKKQLRKAADEDNDDLVAEISIEIKELKKLLA
jgi:hypothetical protein